jgi:opacity protein-like surface antigen
MEAKYKGFFIFVKVVFRGFLTDTLPPAGPRVRVGSFLRRLPMILRNIVATTAVLLPGLALAVDELSYTYVEVVSTTGEVDRSGTDVDFNRVGGLASYELTENFAAFASGTTGEVETTGIGAPRDIDTRDLAAGLTAHFPLFDNVDLIVPAAINYARARAGRIKDSDIGYSIAVGVRALLTKNIEVEGAVRHLDINSKDDQSLIGSARFHFTDALSVAVTGQLSDDVNAVGLNGRFAF